MLFNDYYNAYWGYLFWKKCRRNTQAKHYILMPENNSVYNYYALLHMKSYLEKKKLNKVILLSCDEEAVAASRVFVEENILTPIYIKRKYAERLIKYYSLNPFSSKITIISFCEPYNTCAENLLGRGGVTKEHLVCCDIFGFFEVPRKEMPNYAGGDSRIITFLNRTD